MKRSLVRWTAAIGVVFCAIAVERLLRALGLAASPALPVLIFLLVLAEGIGALVGGLGLLLLRRFALLGLLLFAVASVADMAVDVGLYGFRSLLDGVAWAGLALAFSAAGWLAFSHEAARGPGTVEV